MPKLPRITPDKFVRVLIKLRFLEVRQVGSHKIFRGIDNIRVTVPYHKGTNLHPKILKTFLQDTKLTVEKFIELL